MTYFQEDQDQSVPLVAPTEDASSSLIYNLEFKVAELRSTPFVDTDQNRTNWELNLSQAQLSLARAQRIYFHNRPAYQKELEEAEHQIRVLGPRIETLTQKSYAQLEKFLKEGYQNEIETLYKTLGQQIFEQNLQQKLPSKESVKDNLSRKGMELKKHQDWLEACDLMCTIAVKLRNSRIEQAFDDLYHQAEDNLDTAKHDYHITLTTEVHNKTK